MKASERAVTRAIEEQARAWLITNREQGLLVTSRADFLAWLRASPMHVRAYLRVAKIAAELQSVAEALDTPTDQLVAMAREEHEDANVASAQSWKFELDEAVQADKAPLRLRNYNSGSLMVLAASIAVLAVGMLGWWIVVQWPLQNEYLTNHGEQRVVRLDDGSVVHINSDSILRVAYTNKQRRVSIEHGQALFKVAKDEARPFHVRVGSTDVVAVGTEFDVHRMSDGVVVTVVEGSVAVSKVSEPHAGDAASPAPMQLLAGQQALVAGTAAPLRKAVDVRVVDVRPAIAWVNQQIMFDDQTLRKVVSEFNRYASLQMIIEDDEAAGLRISGVFNAYDLESFVLYLETLHTLEVRREIDRIFISRARDKEGNTT